MPGLGDPVHIFSRELDGDLVGPGLEVAECSAGFDGYQVLDAVRSDSHVDEFTESSFVACETMADEDFLLAAELLGDQVPGGSDSGPVHGGEGLGTSQAWVVAPVGRGNEPDSSKGVELDEGDAGVGAPADGFEADVTGLADDDDALDETLGSCESSLAALPSDSVAKDEVAVANRHRNAVAVEAQDRRIYRFAKSFSWARIYLTIYADRWIIGNRNFACIIIDFRQSKVDGCVGGVNDFVGKRPGNDGAERIFRPGTRSAVSRGAEVIGRSNNRFCLDERDIETVIRHR